jgi:subtilase family serine protease
MLGDSSTTRACASKFAPRASTAWLAFLLVFAPAPAKAAPPDRISGAVDSGRTRAIAGNVHRMVQPQYDRGEASPGLPMNYMTMLLQPGPSQQAELTQLLADQQNPVSPSYHRWLIPESFGERFGLSQNDLGKIAGWLKSQGFTIEHQSRAANWIAFSGTASQTSRAFHTSIHTYAVNGETHFANATDPQVPEALSGIVSAFLGLNDFHLAPAARLVTPQYNTGGQHYVAPADFETIYDLTPLQQSGLDGTSQSIAIVGESDVLASDIANFRLVFGLPANTPRMVLYDGVDPGYNGAEVEGALDLEWAGAIAPKAALYYVYGASAITAMVAAIETNLAPVVSISYGSCEVNFSASAYEALGQQANAQGITIVAASGDSGGAGCDAQGSAPFATLGPASSFPPSYPKLPASAAPRLWKATALSDCQKISGSTPWEKPVVPFSMKSVSFEPEFSHLSIGDLDSFRI